MSYKHFLIATIVSFHKSRYSIDESNKQVEVVLVLSKPKLTDITVQVTDLNVTATSKLST